MRTRIKICGITRVEDAQAVVAAGADAIGLVFFLPSPRNVDLAVAVDIAQSIPPFVTTVGLFVDAKAEVVERILTQVPLDLLQFHGNESPEYCRQFNRSWIKALRVSPDLDFAAERERYALAKGLLLDAYVPGLPGGTGVQFDWHLIPQALRGRVILAGGLNPENIQQAIQQINPYAVDVSGGVEAAKGIKDAAKIQAFVRGVRLAESNRSNTFAG